MNIDIAEGESLVFIEIPEPDTITKPADFFPLWAAMYYPSDEKARRSFVSLSRWEVEQPEKKASSVWIAALEKSRKSHRQGHVAGVVGILLVQLSRSLPPASLYKAVRIASEMFADPRNITSIKKPYSSDPRDVRRSFKRFQNSVHLWAAWNAMDADQHQKIKDGDIQALTLFAEYSGIFETMLNATGVMREWEPLSIPVGYYEPSVHLVLPKLEPWAIDAATARRGELKSPPRNMGKSL